MAGHRGLVGSAIVRRLNAAGFTNILSATRHQLDLRDQAAVNYWFKANRPDYVFLVAGTVGGILANSTRPAEFIYDNLMIHATIVQASRAHDVTRLLYLGSSCIYPRDCPQPIREEYLLSGPLEPTNEAVRHRQDLGHPALSGVPAPVWLRLHLGHADQPLWARRQFRSDELARRAGADAQVPRGASCSRRGRRRSGAPARRGASSCTSTTWPTRACS